MRSWLGRPAKSPSWSQRTRTSANWSLAEAPRPPGSCASSITPTLVILTRSSAAAARHDLHRVHALKRTGPAVLQAHHVLLGEPPREVVGAVGLEPLQVERRHLSDEPVVETLARADEHVVVEARALAARELPAR